MALKLLTVGSEFGIRVLRYIVDTINANSREIQEFMDAGGGPGAAAASETEAGIVELATPAEVTTGTDPLRVVTAATAAGRYAALGHTHVISNVTALQTALDGKAATTHTHAIADVTSLQGTLDGKAASVHTHAQADVTGLVSALAGKASTSHTHAQADVTNLVSDLAGKASTSHTHAQADVTNLVSDLAGKAASSHTHAQADVTGLVSALAGKAASVHTHAAADITSGVLGTARLASTGTPSATTFLRGDQTWATPAGGAGSGPTRVLATADQTIINSAALTNSTFLLFAAAASTKYVFRLVLFFDTTATGDFKYAITGPTLPTIIRLLHQSIAPAATALSSISSDVVFGTAKAVVSAATNGGWTEINGLLHNGGTAADVRLQIAQNAATADTGLILRAGSYIEYQAV